MRDVIILRRNTHTKIMAMLVGDRWRDELPNHEIFCKLQESRNLEPQGTSRRIVKNLTFCLNGDLFVWDNLESVFYTTNLRQLNSELPSHTEKYQVRSVACSLISQCVKRLLYIFIFLLIHIYSSSNLQKTTAQCFTIES